jgi:hypothetical protein
MPLSVEEIAQCEAVITQTVRQDIAIELAEYYGAAVFYGNNEKPEQPNNHIRNALNHLARSCECETWSNACEEHAAAARHLERAKRDSLKLATIGIFDEIRMLLRNAEAGYGLVDPAFIVRRSN